MADILKAIGEGLLKYGAPLVEGFAQSYSGYDPNAIRQMMAQQQQFQAQQQAEEETQAALSTGSMALRAANKVSDPMLKKKYTLEALRNYDTAGSYGNTFARQKAEGIRREPIEAEERALKKQKYEENKAFKKQKYEENKALKQQKHELSKYKAFRSAEQFDKTYQLNKKKFKQSEIKMEEKTRQFQESMGLSKDKHNFQKAKYLNAEEKQKTIHEVLSEARKAERLSMKVAVSDPAKAENYKLNAIELYGLAGAYGNKYGSERSNKLLDMMSNQGTGRFEGTSERGQIMNYMMDAGIAADMVDARQQLNAIDDAESKEKFLSTSFKNWSSAGYFSESDIEKMYNSYSDLYDRLHSEKPTTPKPTTPKPTTKEEYTAEYIRLVNDEEYVKKLTGSKRKMTHEEAIKNMKERYGE